MEIYGELRAEVQRKVGRNLLAFQEIESHLKFMVANSRASGTLTEFAQRRSDQAQKVTKQMLGQLVQQFTDDILGDTEGQSEESAAVEQPWLAFSFRLEVDDQARERMRERLAFLLQQRNDLVHHLLARLVPETTETYARTYRYLDDQFREISAVTTELTAMAHAMQMGMQDVGRFLASDEGKKLFGFHQRHRSLADFLCDLADQKARADGWTYLASAGDALRTEDADLLVELKRKHGALTLKDLLLKEGLVDLVDEATTKGKFRTLYRMRSHGRTSGS